MKKLILIAMMFLTVPVFACDSFEECMNGFTDSKHEIVKNEDGDVYNLLYQGESKYLKAIAYKLDEISKKLEPKTPIRPTRYLSRSGGHCNEDEVGWDEICHKDDFDEYAYSKDCVGKPDIEHDPTWKKYENQYGSNDTQITYRKHGCYEYRVPKNEK